MKSTEDQLDHAAYMSITIALAIIGTVLVAWGTGSWATAFGLLLLSIYARIPAVRAYQGIEG